MKVTSNLDLMLVSFYWKNSPAYPLRIVYGCFQSKNAVFQRFTIHIVHSLNHWHVAQNLLPRAVVLTWGCKSWEHPRLTFVNFKFLLFNVSHKLSSWGRGPQFIKAKKRPTILLKIKFLFFEPKEIDFTWKYNILRITMWNMITSFKKLQAYRHGNIG